MAYGDPREWCGRCQRVHLIGECRTILLRNYILEKVDNPESEKSIKAQIKHDQEFLKPFDIKKN